MTVRGEALIEEAMQYWNHGEPIPLDLFAKLAAVGYDVPRLEELHMQEPD